MSYLTATKLKSVKENKIIIESYKINPDAEFRIDFEDWPNEKITGLTLLVELLLENEIECALTNKFEDADSVMDEEEVDLLVSKASVLEINNSEMEEDAFYSLPNFELKHLTENPNNLPMISFELDFFDNKYISDLKAGEICESTSDTGMAMY